MRGDRGRQRLRFRNPQPRDPVAPFEVEMHGPIQCLLEPIGVTCYYREPHCLDLPPVATRGCVGYTATPKGSINMQYRNYTLYVLTG